MKELIKLSDTHYIVVKDSEIKEGDLVLSKLLEVVTFSKNYTKSLYKKITHSTEPLSGVKLISMDEVLEMRISTLESKLVETSKKINEIYDELNSNNH